MHMDATESTGTGVAWKAFKEAFPVTLPILAGFWFVAFAYGIYMHAEGFSFWYPFLMAACIFGGSLEFVTVAMLLSPFAPFQALMVALMIQARHFFYGIAMLEKYGHMGWKKPFLIFMMCDETFALNYAGSIPRSVDRGWYMLWISVLNYLYWVSGALLGGASWQCDSLEYQGNRFCYDHHVCGHILGAADEGKTAHHSGDRCYIGGFMPDSLWCG